MNIKNDKYKVLQQKYKKNKIIYHFKQFYINIAYHASNKQITFCQIITQTISQTMKTLLIILSALSLISHSITLIHEKKNILIEQNKAYIYQVGLQKQNADLIPSYVNIQYDIYNYNGTNCNYFDFFYYVSKNDIDCYNYSLGNDSYLFPCPFLTNNYALIRTNKVSGINQMPNLEINKIQNLNYTFIIDNTKFPFPSGAYPYTDINVNLKTTLNITVSSLYQELALRLIAINATILSIFLFIIVLLIFKERKIRKQIEGQKKSSLQANLILNQDQKKQQIPQQTDSQQQEQNYTQFIDKNISPSLLQSKQRSILIEYS